jgi:hypothetical protein
VLNITHACRGHIRLTTCHTEVIGVRTMKRDAVFFLSMNKAVGIRSFTTPSGVRSLFTKSRCRRTCRNNAFCNRSDSLQYRVPTRIVGNCRVSGFRFRVSGFGFRVSGFGFRVRVPGHRLRRLLVGTTTRTPRPAREDGSSPYCMVPSDVAMGHLLVREVCPTCPSRSYSDTQTRGD